MEDTPIPRSYVSLSQWSDLLYGPYIAVRIDICFLVTQNVFESMSALKRPFERPIQTLERQKSNNEN